MSELKDMLIKLKEPMPYKWRVQSFSKKKPQATCVAYIDSRDVQDALDKVCDWSDKYYEENGMLFCEITIHTEDKDYKRSDTGSESQAEAQKGHSSDAFKRAAVKFGVGRFLYSLPMKYLTANEPKTQSNYPFVVDGSGKKVWDVTKHINTMTTKPLNVPVAKIDADVRLRKCSTLAELQKVYGSLTKVEKTAWSVLKDKMKTKLS